MTAFILVRDAARDCYDMACWSHRFDVESVSKALSIAKASYPDAPPLAAEVIIDCEVGQCPTRLHFAYATTIAQAREFAARTRGWFTRRTTGGLKDCCQFHTESLHRHLLPSGYDDQSGGGPADEQTLF